MKNVTDHNRNMRGSIVGGGGVKTQKGIQWKKYYQKTLHLYWNYSC